jgi:8-oxo-dGTP pyrophosphatase MutT (NUDIX family)
MLSGTPRYRRAVGIMLLNRVGEVFVARRIDMPTMPAWQMPQGGIDPGETPLQAALRELKTTNVRVVFTEAFELTSGTTGPPSP